MFNATWAWKWEMSIKREMIDKLSFLRGWEMSIKREMISFLVCEDEKTVWWIV